MLTLRVKRVEAVCVEPLQPSQRFGRLKILSILDWPAAASLGHGDEVVGRLVADHRWQQQAVLLVELQFVVLQEASR